MMIRNTAEPIPVTFRKAVLMTPCTENRPKVASRIAGQSGRSSTPMNSAICATSRSILAW